ncbi:MAG: hypothetical protein ACLSH6_10030 [Limosilactobacillus pontis]
MRSVPTSDQVREDARRRQSLATRKRSPRLANQLTVLRLNNVKATIDYIPVSVDVYDAPYGNPVDKVADGQSVTSSVS